MFNKVKDRSAKVVGTGKITKQIARGDVLISHSEKGQIV